MPRRGRRRTPDKPGEVKAAVEALRAVHKKGQSFARQMERQGGHGKGVVKSLAEKTEINEDTVRKMRQFADPDSGYTAEELDALCSLCHEHERALGFSFVTKFITVPRKRGQRAKLQRDTFRNGWSLAELENEMRVRFGRRRQGGRQAALAESVEGVVAQVDSVCLQWQRLVELLRGRDESSSTPGLDSLPPSVKVGMEYVGRAVEQLRQAIAEELDQGRPR